MKNISSLTATECDTELTLHAMKELIQKARKAYQKAVEANDAVFHALEDMCIDATSAAHRCERDSLTDAISEYIAHGTVNLKKLMNDIREWYKEEQS